MRGSCRMPWQETSPMNERVKFVAAMLEAEESFLELCERFGISRKQGYKWKERYELGGVEALADRSRAPHSHPHAVSAEIAELVVAARRKHPTRFRRPRGLLRPAREWSGSSLVGCTTRPRPSSWRRPLSNESEPGSPKARSRTRVPPPSKTAAGR